MWRFVIVVVLVGCVGSSGGGGFCMPSDDGAPCCAEPDMTCPKGSEYRESFYPAGELGGLYCTTPDGLNVGPSVVYHKSGGVMTVQPGDGTGFRCDPGAAWARSLQKPRHPSLTDPDRSETCSVCWDADGARVDCSEIGKDAAPCDQP